VTRSGSPSQRPATSEDSHVKELAELPGLATTTAGMLVAVGVRGRDDLERLGPLEVFRRLRETFEHVSLNFLWALEAIDAGCSWQEITPERKDQLRAAIAAAQR